MAHGKTETGRSRSCNTPTSAATTGLEIGFQTVMQLNEKTIQRKNRTATAGFLIDTKDGIVGIQMRFYPFFIFPTVVLDMWASRARDDSLR